MAFAGKRKTLPSSRWAPVIDVLEEWPVPYADFCEAPAELIDEWQIRISARRAVERREAQRREQEAAAAARRPR